MSFSNRSDAGRRLAAALGEYRTQHAVVLALPRGGVPVAAEVALALSAPLYLILVRKIGVPWQPELAMGAIVDGTPPVTVRNEDVIAMTGVSPAEFETCRQQALEELHRRRIRYVGDRVQPSLAGRTVIVVDDGVATGATVRAALRAVRAQHPTATVLAVPVAPPDTLQSLKPDVDQIVCLEVHSPFPGVGAFYGRFDQVSDETVIEILDRFAHAGDAAPERPAPAAVPHRPSIRPEIPHGRRY